MTRRTPKASQRQRAHRSGEPAENHVGGNPPHMRSESAVDWVLAMLRRGMTEHEGDPAAHADAMQAGREADHQAAAKTPCVRHGSDRAAEALSGKHPVTIE